MLEPVIDAAYLSDNEGVKIIVSDQEPNIVFAAFIKIQYRLSLEP